MSDTCFSNFDEKLMSIEHYCSFPAMMPFVGKNYVSTLHRRLLLIGESNYLPKDSTIHKDANGWYESNQNYLSDDEAEWIHCRHLLQWDWDSPGHSIYREIDRCLRQLNVSLMDEPIEHIAFMNGFQRPADETGGSIRATCTEKDKLISSKVINNVISALTPELVIFVSKYTWDTLSSRIDRNDSIHFDFVSHPADPRHWNVKTYEHGKAKFMRLLNDKFLLN